MRSDHDKTGKLCRIAADLPAFEHRFITLEPKPRRALTQPDTPSLLQAPRGGSLLTYISPLPLKERENVLGQGICLREHCRARLLKYLCASQCRSLCREVSVTNAGA